jgi:hypothetical protein
MPKRMPKTAQMMIFISWSGARSAHIAKALKECLSDIFPSEYLEIWLSEEIEAGKRWSEEISKKLEEANFGILCLTLENFNQPWILFEAGAISKVVSKGRD